MNSEPTLRVYLNLGTLSNLPSDSAAPRSKGHDLLVAIRDAGYDGVQADAGMVPIARELGMGIVGSGRVDVPADAHRLAAWAKGRGLEAITLHVGSGMEEEVEADALMSAIVEASKRAGIGLY